MPVEIDIEHVAKLARMELTDDETARLRSQLGADPRARRTCRRGGGRRRGPPTASPIPRANVYREDVPEPSLPVEEALRNAPEREGDRFSVPRIAETEA